MKQGDFTVKKIFVSIMMVSAFVYSAEGAVKIKNKTAERYQEQMNVEDSETIEEEEAIAILENDIRILDEEIAKCKKQKKGWIAATVIGAAGTVATGVAAGVQGVKIKNKKDEYNETSEQLKSLKKDLLDKDKELKEIKK